MAHGTRKADHNPEDRAPAELLDQLLDDEDSEGLLDELVDAEADAANGATPRGATEDDDWQEPEPASPEFDLDAELARRRQPEPPEWAAAVTDMYVRLAERTGDLPLGAAPDFEPLDAKTHGRGVTLALVCERRILEVGLFGTNEACEAFARRLYGLSESAAPKGRNALDALGESLNLLVGRIKQFALAHAPDIEPRSGLPVFLEGQQCADYQPSEQMGVCAKRLSLPDEPHELVLTCCERTPGKMLAELRRSLEAEVSERWRYVVALFDELREMPSCFSRAALQRIEWCHYTVALAGRELSPKQLMEVIDEVTLLAQRTATDDAGGDDLLPPVDSRQLIKIPFRGSRGTQLADELDKITAACEACPDLPRTLRDGPELRTWAKTALGAWRGLESVIDWDQLSALRPLVADTLGLLDSVAAGRQSSTRANALASIVSRELLKRQLKWLERAHQQEGLGLRLPKVGIHCDDLRQACKGEFVAWHVGVDEVAADGYGAFDGQHYEIQCHNFAGLRQIQAGLRQIAEGAGDSRDFAERAAGWIDSLVSDTHRRSLNIAFAGLGRLVRDLARQANMALYLDTEGETLRVPNRVLELIREPLTTLLRAMVGHSAALRQEGRDHGRKSATALALRAAVDENQLTLILSTPLAIDPRGLGIDPDVDDTTSRARIVECLYGRRSDDPSASPLERPGGLRDLQLFNARAQADMVLEQNCELGAQFCIHVPLESEDAQMEEWLDTPLPQLLMHEGEAEEDEVVDDLGLF